MHTDISNKISFNNLQTSEASVNTVERSFYKPRIDLISQILSKKSYKMPFSSKFRKSNLRPSQIKNFNINLRKKTKYHRYTPIQLETFIDKDLFSNRMISKTPTLSLPKLKSIRLPQVKITPSKLESLHGLNSQISMHFSKHPGNANIFNKIY